MRLLEVSSSNPVYGSSDQKNYCYVMADLLPMSEELFCPMVLPCLITGVKVFSTSGPHWQINGGANGSAGEVEGCLVPKNQHCREGREPVAGLCGKTSVLWGEKQ